MTDEVNKTAQIVPGSAEHDAAMVKLAEDRGVRIRVSDGTSGVSSEFTATPTGAGDLAAAKVAGDKAAAEKIVADAAAAAVAAANKPQRPAHIPEKFWNAEKGEVNTEAMAKSYTELEASRNKPAATPPLDMGKAVDALLAANAKYAAATDDVAKAAAKVEADAARKALVEWKPAAVEPEVQVTPKLEAAMAAAATDFAAKGEIGEESLKALEAAGITREYAISYANGLKAQAKVVEMEVYGEAGGKDEYTKMSEWCAANWTPEQIAAHNAAVTSQDMASTLGAVKTMRTAYLAAQGKSGERVEQTGGSGAATTVEQYNSKEEVKTDMNDPLYLKGDKAFHAKVERKLAASMKAGVNLGF